MAVGNSAWRNACSDAQALGVGALARISVKCSRGRDWASAAKPLGFVTYRQIAEIPLESGLAWSPTVRELARGDRLAYLQT